MSGFFDGFALEEVGVGDGADGDARRRLQRPLLFTLAERDGMADVSARPACGHVIVVWHAYRRPRATPPTPTESRTPSRTPKRVFTQA